MPSLEQARAAARSCEEARRTRARLYCHLTLLRRCRRVGLARDLRDPGWPRWRFSGWWVEFVIGRVANDRFPPARHRRSLLTGWITGTLACWSVMLAGWFVTWLDCRAAGLTILSVGLMGSLAFLTLAVQWAAWRHE